MSTPNHNYTSIYNITNNILTFWNQTYIRSNTSLHIDCKYEQYHSIINPSLQKSFFTFKLSTFLQNKAIFYQSFIYSHPFFNTSQTMEHCMVHRYVSTVHATRTRNPLVTGRQPRWCPHQTSRNSLQVLIAHTKSVATLQ